MRYLVTSIVLLISIVGFSQSKSINGMAIKETTKVENVSAVVTVDSVEEIESVFSIEDIKEILGSSDANQTVSFKIICNGEKMTSGEKSHVSYKIDGNSSDIEAFIMGVYKIRTSAINYYKKQ